MNNNLKTWACSWACEWRNGERKSGHWFRFAESQEAAHAKLLDTLMKEHPSADHYQVGAVMCSDATVRRMEERADISAERVWENCGKLPEEGRRLNHTQN